MRTRLSKPVQRVKIKAASTLVRHGSRGEAERERGRGGGAEMNGSDSWGESGEAKESTCSVHFSLSVK